MVPEDPRVVQFQSELKVITGGLAQLIENVRGATDAAKQQIARAETELDQLRAVGTTLEELVNKRR
jgi:hypothetical protein